MINHTQLALELPGGYNIGSPVGGIGSLGDIVSRILPYIYTIAGILLLIYLLISAYRFLTSGGNPQTMAEAREHMYAALIGFTIVFASYFLLRLAEFIFHFKVTGQVSNVYAASDIGQDFKLGSNGIADFLPNIQSTGSLVSVIVNLLIIGSGVTFVFVLIIGAIRYLFSGGNEQNLAGAKAQLTAGIIGITVAFAAFAIVRFIQFFTGVPILD